MLYWLVSILMIAGISLDLFATMEIEGAMLAEIKPKMLFSVAGLVLLLQIGFFSAGYFLCYYLVKEQFLDGELGAKIGGAIAIVGFGLLGLRLIVKSIRKDNIQERRKDISASKYIWIIFVTTVYTLFAGCAQGLVSGSIIFEIVLLIICTVVVTLGGIYTGYRYGFEMKSWVYGFGAGLLWAGAIAILVSFTI